MDLREMLEGESAMFADGLSMHILIFFLFNFGCAGSSLQHVWALESMAQ